MGVFVVWRCKSFGVVERFTLLRGKARMIMELFYWLIINGSQKHPLIQGQSTCQIPTPQR